MGAEHIYEGKVARCADCIFGDFGVDEVLGLCRNKPPRAAVGFPAVNKDSWCGYFQPVDENQSGTDY